MNAAFDTAISDDEFDNLQALIRQEAGIHLEPIKRSLVVGRLSRRLRILGIRTFGEYYERVCAANSDEKQHMLDAICTNETHFFRDARQFQFLRGVVLPDLEQKRERIRIWSAGCSTGEEPYSLAMMALETLGRPPRRPVEILASDLSSKVLRAAREAIWPMTRAEEIPPDQLKSFMLRGVGSREGTIAASPELRSMIRFVRLNLVRAFQLPETGYDIIFCRNVLIYFDRPVRERVIVRLLASLNPGGYLFLGHAESLTGMNVDAHAVGPTVYAAGSRDRR